MQLKHFSIAFLAIYFLLNRLSAQELNKEFGFRSDNDSYLANGQDRYYTNGLFISYRKAVESKKNKPGLAKKIVEFEIGQKMYNAQSGYIPAIAYVDRSITAYLYGGANLQWFTENERMFKASFQIGTIGPSALGKQAQELVHRITGLYTPKGWEYQLKNELGINLGASYASMIQRSNSQKLDLAWHGYANLGTTFSGLGLGFMLRAGRVNQLFQSASYHSVIDNKNSSNKLAKSEFFFFAKPQLDLVVYDATVSGGLFRQDKGPVSFKPKPWVLSQEFGLVHAKNRLSLQLSYVFKAAEIQSSARAHQYGCISTFYRFN